MSKKVVCRICNLIISPSSMLSFYIVAQYCAHSSPGFQKVINADSVRNKRTVMKCHIIWNGRALSSLLHFLLLHNSHLSRTVGRQYSSKETRRIAAGVLMTSFLQVSIELLGQPELEPFGDCAGGSTNKSKKRYLKMLPLVFKAACEISSTVMRAALMVPFTYDG